MDEKERKPFGGMHLSASNNKMFEVFICDRLIVKSTLKALKELTLQKLSKITGEDYEDLLEEFDDLYDQYYLEFEAETASDFGTLPPDESE